MHVRRVLPLVVAALALAAVPAAAQRGGGAEPPQTPSTPLAPASEKTEALKKEVAADVETRRVFTQQLVDSCSATANSGSRRWRPSGTSPTSWCAKGSTSQRSVAGRANVVGRALRVTGIRSSRSAPISTACPTHESDARRRDAQGAGGRCARSRRGPQRRTGAHHHRRARCKEGDGPRQAARHADAVAGRRGRGARHEGALRHGRVSSRTSTPCCSSTSAASSARAGAKAAAAAWCRWSTSFTGSSSHAAAAPWLGKSALDAVELMDIALELQARAPADCSSARTTSSPTAATSRTWFRPTRRSGTTSARPTTTTSRSCGTSATRWPRRPR